MLQINRAYAEILGKKTGHYELHPKSWTVHLG